MPAHKLPAPATRLPEQKTGLLPAALRPDLDTAPLPDVPAPPPRKATRTKPATAAQRELQIAAIDRDLAELERRSAQARQQIQSLPPTMLQMYHMGKLKPIVVVALEGYEARMGLLRDLRAMSLEADRLPVIPRPSYEDLDTMLGLPGRDPQEG